jgi:2-methylcitrate dehydratase PrpD
MSFASTTAALGAFVAQSHWEDVPQTVRHGARRALLNFVATALGGSQDEAITRAVAVLRPFTGPPQARVIGRSERFDLLNAAFLNAASGNVFDYDDTHHPTVIHPTAPVAPPLLALAETRPVRGADLLHALLLGIEIACRLGNVVTPRHYIRGWHITSTCGAVGAAAASARLLGLDAGRTTWALSHGANQACGLVENLGSMAKSVSVGNAARNGLLSALLAQEGFTASEQALEGPRGFAAVMADAPQPAALSAGLGECWEAERNMLKPYPCGVVLHPVIDACLALRERQQFNVEQIAAVQVRGNPLLRQRADRPHPGSGREAAVSAQHSVAVCLLDGAAGVAQYTDARVRDPVVQSLGARVAVEEDADIAVEAAHVRIRLQDGFEHAVEVAHASGSLARPLTDAQLEAKVHELFAWRGWSGSPAQLTDALWRIDEASDSGAIMRLLSL